MYAVKCENLTKKYREINALTCCSVAVEQGELLGLLGINGEGKTTLIKILCGLTDATEGEAFVSGKNIKTQMSEIKGLIGVSPQETSVATKLTVKENLELFAAVYYKDKSEREKAVKEVVATFGLSEVLNRRAGGGLYICRLAGFAFYGRRIFFVRRGAASYAANDADVVDLYIFRCFFRQRFKR